MNIPDEIKKKIEDAAKLEEIYPKKYGSGSREGYDTMMKYEINDERNECFEKGAIFGYSLASQSPSSWFLSSERLPGMNKVVKWRNGAGGNIPLGENTFLDQYKKVGPNISWHEWLDEQASPSPIDAGEFEKYIVEQRNIFVTGFWEMYPAAKQRVLAEDLLIAYDQMRDRLFHPSPTSGQQAEDEARNRFWTDAMILEFAVRSHLPGKELTIEEFIKLKQENNL